jgi:transcriptional regulator with XRE-family HTH domain
MARSIVLDGPHPVDCHVGRRVAEKRRSRGFNQTDLGKAVGLTFQQIQKYENGSNRISASKLWDFAAFLNVPVSYFFDGLEGGAAETAAGQGDVVVGKPTRQSREIARLAPCLNAVQQKLVLELIQDMAVPRPDEPEL